MFGRTSIWYNNSVTLNTRGVMRGSNRRSFSSPPKESRESSGEIHVCMNRALTGRHVNIVTIEAYGRMDLRFSAVPLYVRLVA